MKRKILAVPLHDSGGGGKEHYLDAALFHRKRLHDLVGRSKRDVPKISFFPL